MQTATGINIKQMEQRNYDERNTKITAASACAQII